ncbi:zf-HC2 domain-containing protein [Kitasatospora sp. NPDC059646]|uniref:zf-HC2 domain-containing protein n=1 Tax=Kitasatospora sp. NPDC059646 TaxID=3346893 RepID=UPI0036B5F02F
MTTPHDGPRDRGPHPDDPHRDLAAHLLGALEPEQDARFAAHLAHCPRCTAEADRLGPVAALLAELAPAAGPESAGTERASAAPKTAQPPAPEPSPELFGRLAGQVVAERRRARVRRLVLAAVAAIIALGGPAVAWTLTEGTQVVSVAQQFSATDPATGVSATVGVDPAAWGSRVTLDLGHVQGPQSCTLVAVGTDGAQQTVTSWTVPATGYGGSTALRTGGGTGLAPSAIARFEVRSGSSVLVVVPVHR